MHNSSNKKLKQQKGKPKMDGLAQPGASKGVSKRSHLQNSSTSWIGGGSTRELGDPSIREPGGPGGGPGTRGPGETRKSLNELRIEEANSTLTPAEICLKQLNHIPGHSKGRSASTRNILSNEKLILDLESEKERSQALEENMKVMNKKQRRLQKQNKKFKGQLKFLMGEITRLSRLHSQTNGGV